MNRVKFLEWLIAFLQDLLHDHRTTHGLWPDTVRRHKQFFSLKQNRAYYHALFRRPALNPKS